MVLIRWNSLAALLLASSGLGVVSAAQDAQQPVAEPIEIVARTVAQEEQPVLVGGAVDEAPFIFVADGPEEASPYWIGVQLEPPTDILKQHLQLAGGMVAVHIFDDSPAAKAGLKANDIILKAGDGYVKEPGDLLKSVGAAKENELTLVIVRGGKEQAIKVVPAKRPQASAAAAKETAAEERKAVDHLEAALSLYKRHTKDAAAVDLLRLRPGVVTETRLSLDLPKDVSVTITKEGSSPAKIVVKKDGQEYAATEDKLNELPDDIRTYVQTVRGGNTFAYTRLMASPAVPASANAAATRHRTVTAVPVPAPAVRVSPPETAKVYRYRVEGKQEADENSKLDQILKIVSQKEDSSVAELRKEVQQLRKELEDLRKVKP